ncbi:MAG: hypothetical protein ACP5TV_08760, partial [Anaerolineae bacterium]
MNYKEKEENVMETELNNMPDTETSYTYEQESAVSITAPAGPAPEELPVIEEVETAETAEAPTAPEPPPVVVEEVR